MSTHFGLEDGVIVLKNGDDIMVVRCQEADIGKKEVVCVKESQISAKGYTLLQAYYYFRKLYIVAKNASSNKYELLRFDEKFQYLPQSSSLTSNEIKSGIVISSAQEIRWDLKIISDDIYIFIAEINQGETNDVPKLVQFTIENKAIIKTQTFELKMKENGIDKFKSGDIQFLPGSSKVLFIVNKAETIISKNKGSTGVKVFTILKIWYGGVNKNLGIALINRFPLKKEATNDIEFC